MILTEIGEIGVMVGDNSYKLRPSLYAMSTLGSPDEIVEVYSRVMLDESLEDALAVIYACSNDDLSGVFGTLNYVDGVPKSYGKKRRYFEFNEERVPAEDILTIAKCLLKHGVTGALKPLPKKDGEQEYSSQFDAREHVSLAIAHLGASSKDAWEMTMTELIGALRAKFPPVETSASRAPSADEYDAAMEWFDRLEEAREAQRKDSVL